MAAIKPRSSWDHFFMQHAQLTSTRSTCIRMKTGAVLVKGRRIISTGYNGTVSGAPHCCDYWESHCTTNGHDPVSFFASGEFSEQHHKWSTNNEIHGEQNCILFAARAGIATDGCSMYTLYSPCINCAKVIVAAGITHVYYHKLYPRDTNRDGLVFLEQHGISVTQVLLESE